MSGLWYIYTMEYYAAIKKKEFLPFVAAWMELESIMLSEISQAMKENTTWSYSFMENREHYNLMNKKIDTEAVKH